MKRLKADLAKYIVEILENKNSRPEPKEVSQLFKELRLLND
jgi:hypothetical protein